jgi:hypothetical protein
MPDDVKQVLWHTEVRGSLSQGYVRIHVFIDPDSGVVRTEVEHADFLGMGWNPMPRIG